jgi:hypothetical protein
VTTPTFLGLSQKTALLTFTGGARNFVVRTNPNYISYSYNLRTQEFPTYGGKVIQILGVNYGTVQIEVESGSPKTVNGQAGGYAYFRSVIQWFKDTSIWQRNNKLPIRMTYPERNYVLDVFLKQLIVSDDLTNVLRPLQIQMEIEDDFSGLLTSDIIDKELQYFQDGIGYQQDAYNDPLNSVSSGSGAGHASSQPFK